MTPERCEHLTSAVRGSRRFCDACRGTGYLVDSDTPLPSGDPYFSMAMAELSPGIAARTKEARNA